MEAALTALAVPVIIFLFIALVTIIAFQFIFNRILAHRLKIEQRMVKTSEEMVKATEEYCEARIGIGETFRKHFVDKYMGTPVIMINNNDLQTLEGEFKGEHPDPKFSWRAVQQKDGEIGYGGGIILPDTPEVRAWLESYDDGEKRWNDACIVMEFMRYL